MMDEYGKLHGHTPAIVTGKPIALEGSYGREAATGRGLVLLLPRGGARARPRARRRRRVVIQGFGNVGSWAARIMHQLGVHAGRASRTRTARSAPTTGIDAEALARARARGRQGAPSSATREPITPEELLAIECEVFIPAALGGMIHAGQRRTRSTAGC